jgi:hypothetical protein
MTLLATTFALLWPSPAPAFTDYATFNYPTTTVTTVTYTKVKHHHHKPKPKPPMQTALASYYTDHGTGACGVGDVQDGYRFASLFLSCGTRVVFCYRSCATATMSDHGPYVAGRTFDLNANLKYGIGCSDLCNVRWRIVGG